MVAYAVRENADQLSLFGQGKADIIVLPTLGADFCVDALEEALARYGRPEIFNTDQGSQFTSDDFTGTLKRHGVMISMDGKGRCLDNIFVERLWRSLKYEEVYLNAYESVAEAKAGIGAWLSFYNDERQHQSLGYRTPRRSSPTRRTMWKSTAMRAASARSTIARSRWASAR